MTHGWKFGKLRIESISGIGPRWALWFKRPSRCYGIFLEVVTPWKWLEFRWEEPKKRHAY